MISTSASRKYLRALSGLHSCLPWARKSDIRSEECVLLYSQLMDTVATQLLVQHNLHAFLPQLFALGLDSSLVLRAVAAVHAEMFSTQQQLACKQWSVWGVKGAMRASLKAQQRALALLETVGTDATQRIDAARRLACANNIITVSSNQPCPSATMMISTSASRKYLRALSGLHSCLPWARKSDIRSEDSSSSTTSTPSFPKLFALGLDSSLVLRAVAAVHAEMFSTQQQLACKQWSVRGVKGVMRASLKAQQRALALLETVGTDATQRIDAARRIACASNSAGHSEL
eukprot:m51a1_g5289 hypothetical protein (288) ;mRNA; f:201763-203645